MSATGRTFVLRTIGDICQIPADRLPEFVRHLQYALELNEMAGGPPITELRWADDGSASSELQNQDGDAVVSLAITGPQA